MSATRETIEDGKATLGDIKTSLKKGARSAADSAHDAANEIIDSADDAADEVRGAGRRLKAHAGGAVDDAGRGVRRVADRARRGAVRVKHIAEEGYDESRDALSDATGVSAGFARRSMRRGSDALGAVEATLMDFARSKPGKALLIAGLGGLAIGSFLRWYRRR